jgi:hypothetical protein
MVRCLEDLIIRMLYLMSCRKGLSIYPLLLFVVVQQVLFGEDVESFEDSITNVTAEEVEIRT